MKYTKSLLAMSCMLPVTWRPCPPLSERAEGRVDTQEVYKALMHGLNTHLELHSAEL